MVGRPPEYTPKMNSSKRKICVVTGSRAEYGLLIPLLKRIQQDPHVTLQIVATAMHLSPEFGLTYRDIKADGFKIDKKIELLLSSDTAVGITKSMGLAFVGFADAFAELKPDILVLLGDRFETFCAAASGCVARVPIAHIHGGEITEGAIDDAFRHAITKMSHLHFTSTEEYRQRVIQLGENSDRVFNVGAIGIENIKNLPLLAKDKLEKDLGFNLGERYFLVTFHPVTLERDSAENQFKELLSALGQVILDSDDKVKILFTKANADTEGRIINQLIDDYVASQSDGSIAITSMGQLRYLSAMKHAAVVIGNSSSGIIEAPSFKVPTVNIGDRQKGRVHAKSVFNCEPESSAIRRGIETVLSPSFVDGLANMSNPYEGQRTSTEIVETIKRIKLDNLIMKRFYDLDVS